MSLNVLVVDDDSGMRLIIKKIINKFESFVLIGEAVDGKSALKMIQEENPDIIFLDVEMPNLNGIECAKKIVDINPKAIIIFATAHEEYMSDAFEVYAFDYITKPFKIERIYKTLRKIEATKDRKNNSFFNKINNENSKMKKIVIKCKEGTSFVDVNDIILVQRENRSTVLYTEDERYETSEALCHLEDRLENPPFFRSHRSYIINISKITKIEPYGRWTYIIKFKNTKLDALITHDKYGELEEMLIS